MDTAKITPTDFYAPSLNQQGVLKLQMADYFMNNGSSPQSQSVKDFIDYDTLMKAAQYNSSSSLVDTSTDTQVPKASPSLTTPSNTITGNSTLSSYMNKLVKDGNMTKIAAAGILGNFQKESSLDPTKVGDNGTSYGMGQWHNSRWNNLKAFAYNNNSQASDPMTQLDFTIHELNTTYSGVRDAMNNAKTPSDAANIFANGFEHMAPAYIVGRARNAENIYKNS